MPADVLLKVQSAALLTYGKEGEMRIKKIISIIGLLLLVTVSGSIQVNADIRYTTIETAADQVRDEVANHASNVKVYFKTGIQSPIKVYERFKQELTKETDNSSEGDYLYWDIKAEIPNYIYYPVLERGKINYYYQFDITYNYYTTRKQKEKVESKVKSLIKNFGFTKNTTDYQKIKTIYDYVCRNVEYAYDMSDDIVFTSYAALFQGRAVCQGYAQLMYKMLREADISVRMIGGYAGGELHGWNIVKLGKYYYNIDATWDSEIYQRGYAYQNFLKGDGFENHIRFDDYSSDEFYADYPMAKSDYGEGNKTLSKKSKIARFKMIKPRFKKVNKKRITLKKVDTGVKYIIQYSEKKNFKGAKKIKSRKRNVYLRKLKKNKKYYIRFQASKVIQGKTVYTKWSAKKTIKIK